MRGELWWEGEGARARPLIPGSTLPVSPPVPPPASPISITLLIPHVGWFITQNQAGSIILAANSSFALDVGTTPGDFTQLKIWQSYPGLMQQT